MNIKNSQYRIPSSLITGIVLLVALTFTWANKSFSQDLRSRMKVEYTKKADESKILSAKLLYRQGRRYVPANQFPVVFSVLNSEEEMVLGDAVTDTEGEALLIISSDFKLPVNEDNATLITATFEGNDSCRGSSSDIEIKDISLVVNASAEGPDIVTVMLSEQDSAGGTIPVQDEYVTIFIERLYSQLPIGDGTTDENGVFEFEYTDDIPGDAEGNIKIIARVEQSDLYGTVEATKKANWGTPVSYEVDTSARALWSDQAPMWMIIATSIVLLGAWFNFILALINLFKIKRL